MDEIIAWLSQLIDFDTTAAGPDAEECVLFIRQALSSRGALVRTFVTEGGARTGHHLLAEIQRRKDLISQGIVHILSTQKLQQRTCPSCKRHLPWNWPYRLCDSCYGRGRKW